MLEAYAEIDKSWQTLTVRSVCLSEDFCIFEAITKNGHLHSMVMKFWKFVGFNNVIEKAAESGKISMLAAGKSYIYLSCSMG